MSLRIVGAGLGRTGTSSLRVALEQLLGGRCYHMTEVLARRDHVAHWRALAVDNVEPDWHALFADYSATLDWPAAAYWEQISAAYPDALVLLSVRASADEWYESFSRTIVPLLTDAKWLAEEEIAMSRLVTFSTFTSKVDRPRVAKRAYEQHNARVRALVPQDRLVEWQPGDGWAPLCAALGVPIPDEPFPHVNTRDEFRALAALDDATPSPRGLRDRIRRRLR